MGDTDDLDPHEKLYRVKEATNDDGTVTVTINRWEKTSDDYCIVVFTTPNGDQKKQTFDWPEVDDKSNTFIRFVEATGYSLVSAEQINESNNVTLPADPDTWTLDIPAPDRSIGEQLKRQVELMLQPVNGQLYQQQLENVSKIALMLFFPVATFSTVAPLGLGALAGAAAISLLITSLALKVVTLQ